MSLSKPMDRKKTYSDYLTLPDDIRVEIIEGVIYDMSPAPSRRHQQISTNLVSFLHTQLDGSGCEIYHAPFDVRLPERDETEKSCSTVVQPDIVVVCDPGKLDEKGCKGAPDLIIEIVSPSTASKDHIRKLKLYERHGVKEYWIVHPVDNIAMRRVLDEKGNYGKIEVYDSKSTVAMNIREGTRIEWNKIFISR